MVHVQAVNDSPNPNSSGSVNSSNSGNSSTFAAAIDFQFDFFLACKRYPSHFLEELHAYIKDDKIKQSHQSRLQFLIVVLRLAALSRAAFRI